MRMIRLRLILLAGSAALALPAVAQEAPIVVDPAAPAVRDVIPPPSDPAIMQAPEPAPAAPPAIVIPAQALTPAIPAVWAPTPTNAEGRSAYGLYLSGRLAALRGDRETSAEFLAQSQALTPEQPRLTSEAFLAALLAGDLDNVTRLSASGEDLPLGEAGSLAVAVEALRQGDGAKARATLATPLAGPFDRPVRYLTPVVDAAAGDWDAALAPVIDTPAELATALILRDQRARLLELRRQYDAADAEFQTLLATPQARRLFGVHYGAFLERRGRKEDARNAYLASLSGQSPDPRALVEMNRMNHRGRAPAQPTVAQIGADALSFAALEATEQGGNELAVIYLQLSLALQSDDSVTLRLAQALVRAEQKHLARDTFAQVGPTNPIQYAAAQVGLADILAEDEDKAGALEALQRADVAAPEQPTVARRLAAGLIDVERYEEALAVLNRPNVNVAGQSPEFHFLRGFALSSLNRLDEAEAELWTALQQAPDNPALLNQLGYLWVDTGRRVDQGAEMLARAHAADPENGNIQDSLGWAQYRLGQYETAVDTLEQAVAKQPSNAEIVDHLGDAYWQVGRKREANWQWTRVLTLAPDAERRTSVERKIASGGPASMPVADATPSTAPVTGSEP
ncbi:MAG: tetratricopeptide repeat protein [Brevundimonas sp.]|nr:MAG: tetratricopeptide repeat protein [Brevundimonas sp.]